MATRHNNCPNPACGSNITGWSGTATPTRSTGLTGLPVTTGGTSTTSGFIQPSTSVVAPNDVVTVSFYVKNRSGGLISGGKQVFVAYTRSSGGDVFPETFNTPILGADQNVIRASFTTAAAPALATGLYLVIDSLPVGIDVTAVLIEPVASLDAYFDGNSPGATWDGATNNSPSTLADAAPGLGVGGADVRQFILHKLL